MKEMIRGPGPTAMLLMQIGCLYIMGYYPEDTGSCRVCYSNSRMACYRESKGIMIDPENGICGLAIQSCGGIFRFSSVPKCRSRRYHLLQQVPIAWNG